MHDPTAAPLTRKRKAANLDENDEPSDNVYTQAARLAIGSETDFKQEAGQVEQPSKRRKRSQSKDTPPKTKAKSTPSTSKNSKRGSAQRSPTACPTCRQKKNKCNPDHIKKLKKSGKHCPECKTDDECESWHWDYYEQRKKLPQTTPADLTIDTNATPTSLDESPTYNSSSASTAMARTSGQPKDRSHVLEVPESPQGMDNGDFA